MTEGTQRKIDDVYELTPMQQGMLYQCLATPDAGLYLIQLQYTLLGALDADVFERSWQTVIDRHPVLRTSLHWKGIDKPVQVVHPEVRVPLARHDWRGGAELNQQERLQALAQDDLGRGFTLEQAPLTRLTLVQLDDRTHSFIWTFHHIALEGWSAARLLTEFLALYKAERRGRACPLALSRPYRDYVLWLQQRDQARTEAYWRNELRGFTAPTELRIDGASPDGHALVTNYGEQRLTLSAATTAALQALARDRQLTLSTVVQGAWALLLSRYSGEEDVIFGTVVSGRPPDLAGSESMIGLFINTLPTRIRVPPDVPLLSWLKQIQAKHVELRAYEHSSLIDIQSWSEVPRKMSLFQTLLVFQNWAGDLSLAEGEDELRVGAMRCVEGGTGYPLTVGVIPGPEMLLVVSYDATQFSEQAMGSLLRHFQTVLEGIVADPEGQLGDVPLMTAGERRQVLVEWNATTRSYPPAECLHQLVEAQVERTPEAVALIYENIQLTYRELNRRANQLARRLRHLGVGPDVRVGVLMERSWELVVGLLGILKAGGAYVPLDPEYPEERLAFMVKDADVSVLLAQEPLLARLPQRDVQVVCADSTWAIVTEEPEPEVHVEPDNLAYVIYTSGSTGRPKGVMNTHRGICNRLLWMQETYQLTADDSVLQKTPFSFDVSVWEFFWPLVTGSVVVLARPEGHRDPAYLADLIADRRITLLHFVPSMLRAFLDEPAIEKCTSVRQVICSGEALPFEIQQPFFDRLTSRLDNLYGPTEAAIDVTWWSCRRQGPAGVVPIGRPVANTQLYVLDARHQPVPPGISGELYIGGVQVARGYQNNPELTAERFIPHPFSATPGARLYRTGDLARYRPDGNLEFLGRLDHQVKVRGFRIELREIEAVLGAHPGVKEAVIVVHADAAGDKRLAAYVVSAAGNEPTVSELRKHCKKQLPQYMVPSLFVELDRLPLTQNGKVDRKALPDPYRHVARADGERVSPRTATERRIAEIWQEVLGIEQVSMRDNFFDLGGHSLLSMQVLARIERAFGRRLSPLVLIVDTLEQIAASCDRDEKVKVEDRHVSESVL